MNDSEFRLCHNTVNRGFQMQFNNGWRISVQFGPGNYCDNRWDSDYEINPVLKDECENAEIALFDPDGNLDYNPEWCDQVKGYVSPDEVARWILECQNKKADHRARPWPDLNDDDDTPDERALAEEF